MPMSTTLASDVDVLERVGTALADTTRRRILAMLLAAPAYPAELAAVLDVSRPTCPIIWPAYAAAGW